ncbi:site-specific DNA-methyltransferase [Bradyrhizobium sp. C9]|uniref:DNA-methyltransferase n=1 Tax=Bradyrhizobium sp. C9 TaxID=142585 RepID=UPI000BEA4FED|nr:site-specific DNA-methyltransferase [Bradyrhizobium sp. C9]PDT77213.1 site-specific DNA-methyltransferase [Bradyrhizobium sp. C9]
MSVQVICGDCRDVVNRLEDESVDLILTDPPYGSTKLIWDRWPVGWPASVRRVLKKTGSMWVFGTLKMFLDRAPEFAGWRPAQDVVWEKQNGSGFHADRFRRVHESAVQFYRDDAAWDQVYKLPQVTNDAIARTVRRRGRTIHLGDIEEMEYRTVDGGPRLMRSVIYVRSEHRRAVHATQKPLGIVDPLLLYSCPPAGVVLDCFAGSGTTGIAAARYGCSSILIEADQDMVLVMQRRLSQDQFQFEVPA